MSRFTVDELHEKYGFKEPTFERGGTARLHPTYLKWLPACWIIENIYGHVDAENMSLGKARELTSAVIEEEYQKLLEEKEWIPVTVAMPLLGGSDFKVRGIGFESTADYYGGAEYFHYGTDKLPQVTHWKPK